MVVIYKSAVRIVKQLYGQKKMVFNEFSIKKLQKFKDNILIYWTKNTTCENVYLYSEILNECNKILDLLKEFCVPKQQRIAISFDHSPALIAIILSILNYPGVFCPILTLKDSEELKTHLDTYEANYIFTAVFIPETEYLKLQKIITIFEEQIYFYCYKSKSKFTLKTPICCYSIKTSGSTGKPKIVQVPYECILPNITSLSKIYNITENDVIFVVSPPTFDPFIVDIFLALKNGSSLLLIEKRNRFNLEVLSTKFKRDCTGITILQITPSVYQSLESSFVENVMFNESSSLRILTLGGEQFPKLDEIKILQICNCAKIQKRIFNIYGITEVSCWSTILEIHPTTTEVTLGHTIDDETYLEVRDINSGIVITNGTGELFIGSRTRKCLINYENLNILNSNEILFRSTGDLVTICESNKIFYNGRMNNIVKRFGHRVDLIKIENEIRNYSSKEIINVSCILDAKKNILVVFYVGDVIENEIKMFLRSKLDNHEQPDEVIKIDKFPLSCHGKISKEKLLILYEKNYNDICKKHFENVSMYFEYIINDLFEYKEDNNKSYETNTKRLKTLWDCSFILAGGTSIQALQISQKIDNFTKQSNPKILQMLLNDEYTLKDILEHMKTLPLTSNTILSPITSQNLLMKILWKYNLKKCIDASSTIAEINSKTFVIVGSHSHILITLDIENGSIISKLELPDRIESQATIFQEIYAFIGCYDGFLYKFEIETGKIIWSFNSNGMIKCKPLATTNLVIFGNYSDTHNLFALDAEKGTTLWSLKLSSKPIYSSPILLDTKYCLACTLDGTCAKINIETSNIIWIQKLSTPIFSTPKLITKNNLIILAEVQGKIHAINNQNGEKITTFETNGSIFSSIEVILKKQDHFILFGCHDFCLYNIKICDNTFHLVWKIKQQSEIFSSPKIIEINKKEFVVSCATKGFVNICDVNTGKLISSLQVDGEVFSSVGIYFNKIFVGCRDNNLYCIDVIDNEDKVFLDIA